MALRAGRLNQYVTIRRRTQTADTQGGSAWTFMALARVAAEVLPVSGNEIVQAEALHAERRTKVAIRYRADVSVKDRIEVTRGAVTRTLEIQQLDDPTGLAVELVALCAEVAA